MQVKKSNLDTQSNMKNVDSNMLLHVNVDQLSKDCRAWARRKLEDGLELLAVSFWMANLVGQSLLITAALFFPLSWWGALVLTAAALQVLWPLESMPRAIERLTHFAIETSMHYFSARVTYEDKTAFQEGSVYMLGLEPHSVLPFALPGIFNDFNTSLPPGLRGIKTVAASVCFRLPATRLYWWAMGVRPAARDSMHDLLSKGHSIGVCPGGVTECLIMAHGEERLYLKRRLGFVKLAMLHGASLVPVFAFGQSSIFHWWRPGPPLFPGTVVKTLAKRIGFAPLVVWGKYGLPIPRKVQVHVAVGKPIAVPKVEDPSDKMAQEYLRTYITAMEQLYEQHKVKSGHADIPLSIH